MSVVCLRHKFGYCKNGRNCSNIHLSEICNKGERECIGRVCEKRHPVVCNFFKQFGRCKFSDYCSYRHPTKEMKTDNKAIAIKETEDEVSKLKTEILNLKGKVESLESLLKDFIKPENKEQKKPTVVYNVETVISDIDMDIESNIESDIESESDMESDIEIEENITPAINFATKSVVQENSSREEKSLKAKKVFKCKKCELTFKKKEKMKIHVFQEHIETLEQPNEIKMIVHILNSLEDKVIDIINDVEVLKD